jgi:hypothetical protein
MKLMDQSTKAVKECGLMNDLGELPKRMTVVGKTSDKENDRCRCCLVQSIVEVAESNTWHTKETRAKSCCCQASILGATGHHPSCGVQAA